ncbi:MAG: right-handed parallel beta-helix repeat-containing protein [Ignavibacteriota bacterium]
MKVFALAALAVVAALLTLPAPGSRRIQLPAGTIELHHEMLIGDGMELSGAPSGTTLRAAGDFDGRALLVAHGARIALRNLTLEGNRDRLEQRTGLPPSNKPFSQFTRDSGVLAIGTTKLRIVGMVFRNVAGFAILVSRGHDVRIENVKVSDSGSRDRRGRNNATGGVLLEEGTSDFHVIHSEFRNIRGNGVWTHSLFASPRNVNGEIAFNVFEDLARDAIQVGHATNVKVEDNRGARIGYPAELVAFEDQAYPVAIDTAGDVDRTVYSPQSLHRGRRQVCRPRWFS